jgi:hypothetical protein
MEATATAAGHAEGRSQDFYRRALVTLRDETVPFLVGGAYALERYTGVSRDTKDFDVFVNPTDMTRVLDALAAEGYRTEIPFPHWLAKVHHGDAFLDVIFSSGNGIVAVDRDWFAHAPAAEVLGMSVRLVPPEEMIWSKAFIMERERYDGADIAHIIRASAERLDWRRLHDRFGSNWRVLLSHLNLFAFIYPSEQHRLPAWLLEHLAARLRSELSAPPSDERICRGTLVSREQYLIDVERWGYVDARLRPLGRMTKDDARRWTAAIEDSK